MITAYTLVIDHMSDESHDHPMDPFKQVFDSCRMYQISPFVICSIESIARINNVNTQALQSTQISSPLYQSSILHTYNLLDMKCIQLGLDNHVSKGTLDMPWLATYLIGQASTSWWSAKTQTIMLSYVELVPLQNGSELFKGPTFLLECIHLDDFPMAV